MTKVHYEMTDGANTIVLEFGLILRNGVGVLLAPYYAGYTDILPSILEHRETIPFFAIHGDEVKLDIALGDYVGRLYITKEMIDGFWAWHDGIVKTSVSRVIMFNL